MSSKNIIQVFEHRPLHVNEVVDGVVFTKDHLTALQKYYGDNGCPYFSLINNGIKFNEHVGVIQVGTLTIEVLPKADKGADDKKIWHNFLINMLRKVGVLDVNATGYASLRLKSNSILELYIELFLKEVQFLIHTGLVKKYRKTEGNLKSMKGSFNFSKHVSNNFNHAERFYVNYTTYDKNNLLNQVLYKTVKLIKHINSSPFNHANIEGLLLDFPECDDINPSDNLFNKIVFDRKNESYRKAINMARLLLLNYHPDIKRGQNDVLALMFNMNDLWEAYVFKQLKKDLSGRFIVRDQVKTDFWKPVGGRASRVKADIVVYENSTKERLNEACAVLDTKWKNQNGKNPSDDDLKQMFVYNLYYNSFNSALLYPSTTVDSVIGNFINTSHGKCNLIFIPLEGDEEKVDINLKGVVDFLIEEVEV